MLNRSILTELASLEARFEAWCVVCIDLIDSCDNVVACVLGIGMYLCVVVVTCTGIIVSKISSKPNEDTPEEKEE
jgi:hypothetical protein